MPLAVPPGRQQRHSSCALLFLQLADESCSLLACWASDCWALLWPARCAATLTIVAWTDARAASQDRGYLSLCMLTPSITQVSHLEHLGAVHPVAGALAHNLGGVHEVVQDGVVHLQARQQRSNSVKQGQIWGLHAPPCMLGRCNTCAHVLMAACRLGASVGAAFCVMPFAGGCCCIG
jgi:hypothetical protein